jgi:hypothetical protein
MEDRLLRIEQALEVVGSRNDRKLKKYSDNFNKMFEFYFTIHRTGVINFCGSNFVVDSVKNGSDAKFAFREYDNGRFKFINPKSRHPNVLKAVISGKKGWGLWVSQWTEGIVECTFTKEEILKEFDSRGIEIPESLMLEWDKLIFKMKSIRNENYLKQLQENKKK